MRQWVTATLVQEVRDGLIQGVIDQRRFSRAGHTGYAGHEAGRYRRIDLFEVVAGRADDRDLALRVRRNPFLRHGNTALAREVLPRERLRTVPNFFWRSGDHDFAAMHARTRTEVDDMVGSEYCFFVVLDDDDRVADVSQMRKRAEQSLVVALVQADRGLIEDVHDADKAGANLASQSNALRFATR